MRLCQNRVRNSDIMEVLIVGGGLQGLSCGSSLRNKHSIHIITDDLQCRKSSFFKGVYTGYEISNGSYLELLEKNHFDIVIPVSDVCVPFLSKNKENIEQTYNVRIAVPEYDCVYTVESKERFMSFCATNDIPHPKTMSLSKTNLEDVASQVGFPALIKPDYSVGARGIQKVKDLDELTQVYPDIESKYGSCTLQEFIANQDYYYNVMLYRDKKGDFLASAIIKIVRMYPVAAGSSACCISVENEELLDICKQTLNKLNWVGMADFDVLQRLDNGEFKIIEINPRVPASLRGAAISGVNFPEVIISDVMNLPVSSYQYHPNKVMRYIGIDLMWLLKTKKLVGNTPSWWKFCGKDVYYQDVYAEDASTWWTWFVSGLSKLKLKNKRVR